jgi:Peptidase family S41/N-terminal domain of Peptidase_S41 in eukaryotic IRBP
MLRPLYCCVLRLHPPGFRQRFAEEMLSIFDHAEGEAAAFRLLLDGLLSLARQWTLRPEFWHDISPTLPQKPAPDGIPSFYTLAPFRPRIPAVIHALVLSTAVFCLTWFAIKYSRVHVVHVRIPEVRFDSLRPTQANRASSPSAIFARPTIPPHAGGQALVSLPVAPAPAFDVPKHTQSNPSAAQNPVTRNLGAPSAVGDPGSQASSGSSAQTLSLKIANQGRLQLYMGTRLDQPQAQQPKPQYAAGALAQAATGGANLDAAERQRVLDRTIADLRQYYFDRDVAQKISDALRAHEKSGAYNAVTEGRTFADLLTWQMRDTSHDMHLIMQYSRDRLPEHPSEPTPESLARYRKAMVQENCMFKRTEILSHNIGYLKLNFFPDTSVCEPAATAAMASLNHADAIIFDLRDNTGGIESMVSLIASYLFDHPEYMYSPREVPTEQSWTRSPVPGARLADKPVYVLTSASTWSGAEQFSYDLKMLKRAILVGETTRGGAHAGVFHRIDDHFGMGIPEVKPINPFGKADWEGAGVEPDVKVKAADALETAKHLAESELREK